MPSTSARRLRIPHPSLASGQKTYLTTDYSSGTTVNIQNSDGFAANDIMVIGEPGVEKTEQKRIQSIVATTSFIIPTALKYTHNKGDIVYTSEYDQVEISSNTGSWSVLATIDIQWDGKETVYIHQGGTDATSYRFRFSNSVTGDTSEYSPTIGGGGFVVGQIGYHLDIVRGIVNDRDKKIVSDSEILRFFTEAKNIIRARRNDWWFWKKFSDGTITTTANILKYNLDTISDRVEYIGQIRYRLDDGTQDEVYPIDVVSDIEFYDLVRDSDRQNNDHVEVANIMPPDSSSSSGYIRVYPTPATTSYGSFYIDWYKNETDYTSVSDTTDIPIPALLENFAIAMIEQLKGNDSKAKLYRQLFFGPSNKDRKNEREMTGIALLEQLQNGKGRALNKPRVIRRWAGRNTISRVYRTHSRSADYRRENYF